MRKGATQGLGAPPDKLGENDVGPLASFRRHVCPRAFGATLVKLGDTVCRAPGSTLLEGQFGGKSEP